MQNNLPLRTLLITCGALFLLAAAAYVYLNHAPAGQPSPTGSTTSQTLSDGTVVSGLPEGATVTEETSASQPVAPNYRAPVAYGADVTADVKAAIEPRLAADIALLAKNNQDFNAWMDLAILHKIGGDYRGAEAIWLYATKQWPTSYVAFHNLGDLYQNFLKDSAKAKFYSDQATRLGTPKQYNLIHTTPLYSVG